MAGTGAWGPGLRGGGGGAPGLVESSASGAKICAAIVGAVSHRRDPASSRQPPHYAKSNKTAELSFMSQSNVSKHSLTTHIGAELRSRPTLARHADTFSAERTEQTHSKSSKSEEI